MKAEALDTRRHTVAAPSNRSSDEKSVGLSNADGKYAAFAALVNRPKGIVTLIEVAAKDYNDALSGCRARAIPHIEDVSPKSFERGSVE